MSTELDCCRAFLCPYDSNAKSINESTQRSTMYSTKSTSSPVNKLSSDKINVSIGLCSNSYCSNSCNLNKSSNVMTNCTLSSCANRRPDKKVNSTSRRRDEYTCSARQCESLHTIQNSNSSSSSKCASGSSAIDDHSNRMKNSSTMDLKAKSSNQSSLNRTLDSSPIISLDHSSLNKSSYLINSLLRSSFRRSIHLPYNYHSLLVPLLLCLCTVIRISDACSARSTPKPRPPLPEIRPNITFQTYQCPEAYAKWYCLNGATCFFVRIGESILYNCECADGYMGQRCEFKDLEGSYLQSREKVLLETAKVAGGAFTILVLFVFVALIGLQSYNRRKGITSCAPDKLPFIT